MSEKLLSIHPSLLSFALAALAALTSFFSCEEEETTIEVICEARCKQYRRCDQNIFRRNYCSSIETCEESCEQVLTDRYDDFSPAECEKEAKKLELCHVTLTSCDDAQSLMMVYLDGGPDPYILAPIGCEEEALAAYDCGFTEYLPILEPTEE